MDFKKFYRKLTGYEAGQKAGHDAGRAEGFEAGRDVNGGDKLCQMAARKCTDLVKRKGAMKPRFIFVLPCRFMFWWRGLLRLVSLGFGFAPEPIAVVPSCWWRGGSFRHSSPGYGHDE